MGSIWTKCEPLLALAVILTLSALIWPSSTTATVMMPHDFIIVDGTVRARAGEPYVNTMQVELPEGGSLEQLSFGDNGWTTVFLEQPPEGALPPNTVLELDFEVIPSDPEIPLRLEGGLDGRRVSSTFDLSLQGYERENAARGITTVPIDPVLLEQAVQRPQSGLEPLLDEAILESPSGPGAGSRVVTVSGDFWYQLPSGALRPAFGLTVEVRDDDRIGSNLLTATLVESDGSFSTSFEWDPGFLAERDPDIFLRLKARNTAVRVKANFVSTNVYRWDSATVVDYEGTNLDFTGPGEVLTLADEDDNPALHILANLSKAYNWFEERDHHPFQDVTVNWPTGNGANYVGPPLRRIQIPAGDQWNDATQVHEYGHHWMYDRSVFATRGVDYCNGICDDYSGLFPDCTHCNWCQENEAEAWDEGVPDWIADMVTRSFLEDYGFLAWNSRTAETAGQCDDSYYDSPPLTEGFTHLLLYDIVDDDADEDAALTPEWRDALNRPDVTAQDVLDLIVSENPGGILAFIDAWKEMDSNPSQLWETATNCSFTGLDLEGPDGMIEIGSSSHEEGGPASADNTIDFSWGKPDDDFSGTNAYKVKIWPDAPIDPGSGFVDVLSDGAAALYTTEPLDPGVYYFSVRARDRAGNWSPNYYSAGPYEIREPEPADIAYGQNLGAAQAGPLVIRADDTAIPAIIQWSNVLPGGNPTLYWNNVTTNLGDESVSEAFFNRLYVDGKPSAAPVDHVLDLEAMTNRAAINIGPFEVPSGRHTVSVRYDYSSEIPEPDEANNSAGASVVFEPSVMTPEALLSRAAPPSPTGGHDDLEVTVIPPANRDGLRFQIGAGYDGVVVWSEDLETDYNVSLHTASSSYDSGFGPVIFAPGFSAREAGRIDAIITNTQGGLPTDLWDVGVLNANQSTSDYKTRQMRGRNLDPGVPDDIGVGGNFPFVLRGVTIPPGELGWKDILVSVDPSAGPVHVAWYPASFLYGALEDYSAHTTTDETGEAILTVNVTEAGRNLITLWRDPIDDPSALAGVVTVNLELRDGRADLTLQEWPEGWYGPVVPRPDTDGTPEIVFGPTYLTGGELASYLNLNVYNEGETVSGAFDARVDVDGALLATYPMASCPPGQSSTVNATEPVVVRAGRHSLSLTVDPAGTVDEGSTMNNRFAEQYVWMPTTALSLEVASYPGPSGAMAGWEDITTVRGPLRLNCDGFHLEPGESTWWGVAAQPDPGTDVDLRLFEVVTDAKSGYGDPVAMSGWLEGELDFIIANSSLTAPRPFHVGVVGVSGSGSYQAEAIESVFLDSSPTGEYGPFTLDPDELMKLHEIELEVGFYRVLLEDVSSTDLQFSVHGGYIEYGTRSRPVEDGESFIIEGETGEYVDIVITRAGSYCIGVWRRDGVSPLTTLPTASYTLEFSETSSVDPELDAGGPLTSVEAVPNPFRSRSTLRFSLNARGWARVHIYDLAGRRIRSLHDGELGVGTHEYSWFGRDDGGRVLPAGVYFYRIDTPTGGTDGRITFIR